MTATATTPANNVVPLPVQNYTFQRGDEVELAEAARRQLQTSELTHDAGRFWRYNPALGIWVELGSEMINETLAAFAGAPLLVGHRVDQLRVSSRQINGARAILRDALLADPGHRRFLDAIPGLAFANGFVRVQNGRVVLLAHSPDHLARHAYPFRYQAHVRHIYSLDERRQPATARLLGFLHTLFADVDYEERQERIALYQEFVGTCLIAEATRHQRVLTMHGEGGNGKSQALEIARSSFPRGSVVSLPPQLWAERFQITRLVGALANFVDEVPERDITGGEVFKSVITGEPVHAEQKHQPAFEFKPVAGHIFSSNTLPGTVDQSDGYWRRHVVLPFTRNMEEAAEYRPQAARDVIDAELPAIVAWFLEGAARVQRQGGYTIPASSVELVQAWRKNADPVLTFAAEECVPDPLVGLRPDELFQSYKSWASANNFAPMSSTKFFRRFSKTKVEREHTNTGNVYLCRVPNEALYRRPREGS